MKAREGKNALAYLSEALVMTKKVLTLGPGACIIKLITAVIYGFCNKLDCLSLASLSKPV
jgi:hypothetical protein